MAAGAAFSVLFAETAFAGVWLKGEGVNQDKWWYANTTTPNRYVVNENGAMVLDGQVSIQAVQAPETAPAVDAAA